MFLARTVEHTVDVDGMLNRMDPILFEKWAAMYRIHPWGLEPMVDSDEEKKPSTVSAMRSLAGV